MTTVINSQGFSKAILTVKVKMAEYGQKVHPKRWQGIDLSKRPEGQMYELSPVFLSVPLNGLEDLVHWRKDIQPNLPWADNHFDERVCGQPVNPGKEWANWPWGNSAKNFLKNGLFNHNYMERYWPKWAGGKENFGIRGSYGDLNDLVELLVREPLTRQAYIPIFFPEDTGVGDGGRKPCTLGYHFLMRDNQLNVFYPMRSCDLLRHFADDIYLTLRLLLWVLDRAREKDPEWERIKPGRFDMYVSSMHLFVNDLLLLKKQLKTWGQIDVDFSGLL